MVPAVLHWDELFAAQDAVDPAMVTVYCAVPPSPWVPTGANPLTDIELLALLVT